jgi:acetyl esterase/lipase
MIARHLIGARYRPGFTIEGIRKGLEAAARISFLPAQTTVKKSHFHGIPAEWVCGKNSEQDKAILYLHGGGYNSGSPNTHRELAAHISNASGATVLVPDYRLAPEHAFPAALEDAVACYRRLIREGFSNTKIAIAGDSAGGGLTLATCFFLKQNGDPLPSSLACISPWTDLEATGDSIKTLQGIDPMLNLHALRVMASNYISDHDPRLPTISPLYSDFKDFPPTLVQVGSDEILLDDSVRIAEKAREAGVDLTLKVFDDLWHVFHVFYRLMPEAKNAVKALGAFIQGHFR